MKSKWLKWILAGGALVAVMAFVGVYGVSIVQASTGLGSLAGPKAVAHPGFGDGTIDMQALLAEELGISVEELETAQQAAFETAVALAVDEGKITQEQADQILERDGIFGRGRGFGLRGRGELPEDFEPGEGFGHGRGRFRGEHHFGPPSAPQEDASNTTNA